MPLVTAADRVNNALSKNGYEQVRTVGEGSFGKAILVRRVARPSGRGREEEAASGASLIVKMVDVSRATRKEREDALQESQVLSSLKHPHIVRYRNNFLEDGWLCIVMDYCEGGDLSGRIKKKRQQGGYFAEKQVLWWFSQGTLALKYIHDRHILHRDLKSSNFFLSKSGNLKMGDFGIAKVLECTAACAQTQVGTPYYMCPEICKGRPYAFGSDIWAMGCILYEICAKRVPFDGHDLKSLIQNITKAPTPDLPHEYSRDLNAILRSMLTRDPNMRPEADDILKLPVITDIVKRMSQDSKEQERRSEVSNPSRASECAPPSSVESKAEAVDQKSAAGTYSKKDLVEYYSGTHGEWLPATVIAVDDQGRITLDIKPNAWLSSRLQADRVRPRPKHLEAAAQVPAADAPVLARRPSRRDTPPPERRPSGHVADKRGKADHQQPPIQRRRSEGRLDHAGMGVGVVRQHRPQVGLCR
mmetsp:Transcript_94322/g.177478  ORF Transcript_94322/g.177478 Transcript_94322/m.177478 type:complete len:473 (+) Transcript_94322:58-1476(+)